MVADDIVDDTLVGRERLQGFLSTFRPGILSEVSRPVGRQVTPVIFPPVCAGRRGVCVIGGLGRDAQRVASSTSSPLAPALWRSPTSEHLTYQMAVD